MLLQEFIYFERDQDLRNNDRYDISRDTSVIKSSDLRKSRLTLKMLNELRKAGDAREQETLEDLAMVKLMYATPAQPPE